MLFYSKKELQSKLKIVVRKDVCGRKGVCEKWCFCLWRKARFVEFFYLEPAGIGRFSEVFRSHLKKLHSSASDDLLNFIY